MIELRTPTLADMNRHTRWARIPEIVKLDPPAGIVESPVFWSIYLDNLHVGTVSIYNRAGITGELGILIGDSTNWSKGYGTDAIKKLLTMCKEAGFVEIHLKVLLENTRAIRCYEKCGFTSTGYLELSGMNFLQMSIRI